MVAAGSPLAGRRVVYLSGTAGDTRRYRCSYQSEALASLGVDVAVFDRDEVPLEQLCDAVDVLILHRVAWDPDVESLIDELSARGVPTVYDTDDYVFDADAAGLVDWPPDVSVEERRTLFELQRKTLAACSGVTTSTLPLARLVRERRDNVGVLRNVIGAELLAEAQAADRATDEMPLKIVYLSGTPTHDRDFEVAADAVLHAADRHRDVQVVLVGYLDVGDGFDRLGDRLVRLPFQPRAELPLLLRGGVNLAPLERTRFTAGKSCIKYLEAALVGVPTVASSVGDYRRAISHGRNGLLADSPADWSAAIDRLLSEGDLRRALGCNALEDVLRCHTAAARAQGLATTLLRVCDTGLRDPAPRAANVSRGPDESGPALGGKPDMDEETVAKTALETALDEREERIEILSREVAMRDAEQTLALAEGWRRIEALEARVDELAREVELARGEAAAHARHVQTIYGTLSWRVTKPLRAVRRRVGAPAPVASSAEVARQTDLGAVLFVSGAPEVARRYRCLHQAEQLEHVGAVVETAVYGDLDLAAAAERYAAFVLHRVPWAADVEELIDRARQLGRRVLFDSDDLVFEPAAIDSIAVLDELPEVERRLYIEGIDRFRRTLAACDGGTFSTDALARHAAAVNPKVEVAYNVASRAMVANARIDSTVPNSGGAVTIGYMSGTNTHNRDFLEAAPALLEVLERHRETRLRIVGPLVLDARFEPYADRIESLPLQDWERLPDVQRTLDINLAPLQPDSAFTESKSCVKWIEAGLVGVPTIATPTDDFRRVIDDGQNGLLAADEDGWRRALEALVGDPEARRRIGQRARRDIETHWTTAAQASAYRDTLGKLAGAADGPLTINWVMQSPIAQNSGGYRNIFRIANELGRRGHRQRFYVERVAHLAGLSRERVEEYVDDAFGLPEHAEVVLEHDSFAPADVAVATFWRTAIATARQRQSLFRAYFVQDFEPEFYENTDPLYHAAAATYRLPLRLICLGEHLRSRLSDFTGFPAETVDFALDDRFRLHTPLDKRGTRTRVLYFARPSLRRRGYPVGVEALRRLKERHPDVDVVFFGSPSRELGDVPFEFIDLGVLDADGVARAMNEAHVLLTFSLTNISNVPFEGMACGCAVVDLDTPNVTSMVEADAYLPTPFDAGALADSLSRLVEDPELRLRLARRGAETQAGRTWSRTADMFEDVLLRTCFLRMRGAS